MIGTADQREKELSKLYPVWEKDTQWTWFRKNCRRFSDRVFLIDEHQSNTYQDIYKLAVQASGGLYACGVRPGMTAAVDMANRKELVAAVFALSRLRCMAVMVNPRISDSEREYVLRKSDVQILITDRPYGSLLCPETEVFQVLVQEEEGSCPAPGTFRPVPKPKGEDRRISWNQLLDLFAEAQDERSAEPEEESPDPERTSMVMFTSGSTSHPKGVMLTDNMLLRSAFATANTRHMEIGRRIYLPIPLCHAMAYVEGMLAAAMVGGSIVISGRKAAPDEHLLRMQKYEVNDIVCISSVMIRMMTACSGKCMRFPAMHAAYWAGVCPEWVWETARGFFHITDCGNGYGMTECGSTSNVMSVTDPAERTPFCHGRIKDAGIAAFPEGSGTILSMKITAEDGRQCLPGEAGEIVFKGIGVTKGYYRDPSATAKLFDENGWMHSGDLGVLDEEGYLTFLGRIDDQYKVNGENVSPEFVGNVLLKHKNIRYAEVVGIPHDRCGQAGAAFVEFYENREDAVSEIQEYIREKLARFQQPAWILPMKTAEWPKTSTGKIARKALKEIAADYAARNEEENK